MTVVIGIICQNAVILASDGYALEQQDKESVTVKNDFYPKISIIGAGKFIIGNAGSHTLSFQVNNYIDNSVFIDEKEIVDSLGEQIKNLNRESDKKSCLLFGYVNNKEPVLYFFNIDGSFKKENIAIALGSGADNAMAFLNSRIINKLELSEGIHLAVETIYYSSRTPTVNFVPMVAYISTRGFKDLSKTSIEAFKKFKNDLRKRLCSIAHIK